MRTLIVYYSLEGNTAFAAEKIAGALGAELLRLEPEKAYPDCGMKKFLWGVKSAVMGEEPPLKPYVFRGEDWDRVIIGFPVWAGTVTPPIRTFVKAHGGELAGKSVAVFACQSGCSSIRRQNPVRRMRRSWRRSAETSPDRGKLKSSSPGRQKSLDIRKRILYNPQ